MDEQLKEKFESFEMIPPDAAWLEIKKGIKTRRGVSDWFYLMAAFVCCGLMGVYMAAGSDQFRTDKSARSGAMVNENTPNTSFENRKENSTVEYLESESLNGYSAEESKYKNLSDYGKRLAEKSNGNIQLTASRAEFDLERKERRSLEMSSWTAKKSVKEEEGDAETGLTPEVSGKQNDLEESLLLPRKLTSYYFINSANPTKPPFCLSEAKQPSFNVFKRFSIDGGIGLSTFRINSIDKNNPALKTALDEASSGEIGYGAHLGINYAFHKNYAFSAGLEILSQRNKVTGNSVDVQTTQVVDTVGFFGDSLFNQQDSVWYLDTMWIVNTSEYETSTISPVNSINRTTMIVIPFSFSMRKSLGIRSALEFNLGGSIGIYQTGTGRIILNSSGEVISLENAYRRNGQLTINASVKYLYQLSTRLALYVEPRVGLGVNNFYQSTFNYQSRISQLGIKVGYRVYF